MTSAIGVQGLVSLDRLFALRAKEMCLRRDIIDFSDALIFHEKTWIIDMLDNLSDSLSNGSVMANPAKFYYQVPTVYCLIMKHGAVVLILSFRSNMWQGLRSH